MIIPTTLVVLELPHRTGFRTWPNFLESCIQCCSKTILSPASYRNLYFSAPVLQPLCTNFSTYPNSTLLRETCLLSQTLEAAHHQLSPPPLLGAVLASKAFAYLSYWQSFESATASLGRSIIYSSTLSCNQSHDATRMFVTHS